MMNRDISIKNDNELMLMREAGRLNAKALAAVREAVRPGISTAELDRIAENMIRENNAEPVFKGYPGPYPYPATLTICVNSELVHGIPSEKILLQEGDLVSIDCGTYYKGYVGDSAFTMGVGTISDEAQRLIDVTEQSLYEGIKKMWPGNRLGDVSSSIQNYVEKNGYFVTRIYTGHGVGKKMHEGPQLPNYGTPGKGLKLEPGMTIAIEPMVLVGTDKTRVLEDKWTVVSADGSLTAHFEHTVGVTESGPIILTSL
ncbi:MAG: type I methionyl aminopeptidase [Anaerolineales bacterium]